VPVRPVCSLVVTPLAFPRIQHFVVGEAEGVIPQVAEDVRASAVRPCYEAG
jgi:hypothetical protein